MPIEDFSPAEKVFLTKVMRKSGLPDIHDARDLTIVVFRSLRDLMTTEAAVRTEETFDDERVALLWKDDNPLVALLSKLRPPLKFDTKTFLRRINQEGGVPKNVKPEDVVSAVFSTVKEELSSERIEEISSFLPDGLKAMWNEQ
ncbi:MAG: DUF2267 domain-containing protein [Cyanobacteria bacterium P01_F01_bin.116]